MQLKKKIVVFFCCMFLYFWIFGCFLVFVFLWTFFKVFNKVGKIFLKFQSHTVSFKRVCLKVFKYLTDQV